MFLIKKQGTKKDYHHKLFILIGKRMNISKMNEVLEE